ncbi:hypothetical protein GCM10018781_13900 [Kitasatospora indigofera]|uniref:Uncharacterized protein n=1 Tax=Kitasatospora indigofera TaxID=67307 RepID=A0A919FGB6_9ACTN|nr:hypothetical protein [Kitasatospora indigofera]GHH63889.1 hypothetical protein GCM10018781_13900 [Kitasatospora indigofera]
MTSQHAVVVDPPPAPAPPAPGRAARLLGRPGVFAVAAGAAATALMAARIFLPGPIGLADNGDGPRRMCALDSVVQVDPGSAPWWAYVNFGYVRAQPGECEPAGGYRSSAAVLLRLARPLGHWLGLPGEVDLRALAVLFCLLAGLAVGVFAAALRGGLPTRSLICLALFLVVGDSIFAGYAASPYSETAGLLGILLAAAGATHLGGSPRARRAGLLVLTAGAVLAVASKTQAVTMALPFAALLLFAHVPPARAARAWAGRVLPCCAAALIVATGAAAAQWQPEPFKVINPTEVVFVGLLGAADDPAAAAVELGLPADFAQYAGRSWWSADPPQNDPRWPGVRGRMTYPTVARFLLHHPDVAAGIALGAVEDFGAARPGYLGSYPVGAGEPAGSQESRLAVFGTLLRLLGGGPLLLLVLGLGAGAAGRLRALRHHPARRAFASAVLCLAGVTAVQFLTAAYGEAVEGVKHQVFAICAAGLVLVLAAAGLCCAPRPGAAGGGALPPPRQEPAGAQEHEQEQARRQPGRA